LMKQTAEVYCHFKSCSCLMKQTGAV
jgi:hypothetical protein